MNSVPDMTHRQTNSILEAAARASLRAPSVFNTQPWRWRIAHGSMELSADPARRLEATDPQGRLLRLSCGAALHHARTALAAAGWSTTVQRLHDETRPHLLARLHLGQQIPPDPEAQLMADAISKRRTDRRAFGERKVARETVDRLRHLVEAEGAYLHIVPQEQVPMLAISTELAGDAELLDPAYREELTRWTSRPAWTGDGVPPSTAVQQALRRVPVRDFIPDGTAGLKAGPDYDEGAVYVVLFGRTDDPVDLLRGGEALSALLLKATAEGLSTAPLTDAVEVTWPRHLIQGLLSDIGNPYAVVRLGYVESNETLPATPRRAPAETIVVEE